MQCTLLTPNLDFVHQWFERVRMCVNVREGKMEETRLYVEIREAVIASEGREPVIRLALRIIKRSNEKVGPKRAIPL